MQRSSLSMEKQPRTFLRKGQGLNRFNSKSLAVRQELDTPVVQTSEETKVNVQDVQDDTANSKLSERNLRVDDSFYVRTSYRQEVSDTCFVFNSVLCVAVCCAVSIMSLRQVSIWLVSTITINFNFC